MASRATREQQQQQQQPLPTTIRWPPLSVLWGRPRVRVVRDAPPPPILGSQETSDGFPTILPEGSNASSVESSHHHKRPEPPFWSTSFARQQQQQQHPSTTNHPSIRWRAPGKKERSTASRSASELLAYGLASLLPYYGDILPALRYDPPLGPATRIEIATVPELADVVLDINECTYGIGYSAEPGGVPPRKPNPEDSYHACFAPGNATGNAYRATREHCYKGSRNYPNRIHRERTPGHELWSCSDASVMEQLRALEVLDYFLHHGDRFYKTGSTNNLFFLRGVRPVRFVSIDHHGSGPGLVRYRSSYPAFGKVKHLKSFGIPKDLRENLASIKRLGQSGLARALNASLDGHLDGMARLLVAETGETEPPSPSVLVDVLWKRFASVCDHFKIRGEEDDNDAEGASPRAEKAR